MLYNNNYIIISKKGRALSSGFSFVSFVVFCFVFGFFFRAVLTSTGV